LVLVSIWDTTKSIKTNWTKPVSTPNSYSNFNFNQNSISNFHLTSSLSYKMSSNNFKNKKGGYYRKRKHEGDDDTKPSAKNPNEWKFAPLVEGRPQKTFAAIKQKLLSEINKNDKDMDDVHDSLSKMELKDLSLIRPVKEIFRKANAAEKKAEQETMNGIFSEKCKAFVDRERSLEKGMRQMFFKILDDYCTPSMQQKVQMHPDHEKKWSWVQIALLQLIEQLMLDSVRTSYKWRKWFQCLKWIVTFKMQPNEDVLDYVKRFKQVSDNLKTTAGDRLTNFFIESGYDY